MSIPGVIDQYLHRHHIPAEEHEHPAAFTAHQLAVAEHMQETLVAKTVFFLCDDQLIMGVLPANRNLSLHRIKAQTRAQMVRLATEREIEKHIGSLHLGAVPPFGSLFGLPVFLDKVLAQDEVIEVPGGLPTESLRIRMDDFIREEAPQVMELSRRPIRLRPIRKHEPMDYY